MKISILGTNGFLSTAIAKYCNKKDYQLIMYGLDNPTSHKFDKFTRIDLMNEEIDYQELGQSQIIVYAIGAGIQSNLKEGNDLIYNLNVTAPVRICNGLKSIGYKGIFITFGSVFEIGETPLRKPFTQTEVLCSTSEAPNDYAVSKRMLSRFVSSYKHDYTHWHFYLPTIYGAGENPMRLIPYTVNAIRKGTPLHFTAGDQIRQYIHVNEIPAILDRAFSRQLPSGLYNVAGIDTLSVKEVVSLVHQVLGKEVPTNCFGSASRADVGMKYLALDGSKLYDAINYKPQIKLADAIKTY